MTKARRHAIRVLSEYIDLENSNSPDTAYERYRALVDRFPELMLMK